MKKYHTEAFFTVKELSCVRTFDAFFILIPSSILTQTLLACSCIWAFITILKTVYWNKILIYQIDLPKHSPPSKNFPVSGHVMHSLSWFHLPNPLKHFWHVPVLEHSSQFSRQSIEIRDSITSIKYQGIELQIWTFLHPDTWCILNFGICRDLNR